MNGNEKQTAAQGSAPLLLHIDDSNGECLYSNAATQAYEGVCDAQALAQESLGRTDSEHSGLARLVRGHYRVGRTQLVEKATGQHEVFDTVSIPVKEARTGADAICTLMTPSEIKSHEMPTSKAETYDSLTGLASWNLLHQRLAHALAQLQTEHTTPGALLVLNLDGFGLINRVRGREIGDTVLRIAAKRLLSIARASCTVARIEGAHFAALVPELNTPPDSQARYVMGIAHRMQLAIGADPIVIGDASYEISVSIGVALLRVGDISANEMLREAEAASARARKEGGGRIVFYEPKLQTYLAERLEITQSLARALETKELKMFIQPQYAHDGTVTGAELLARWTHATRGVISPAIFIPLAEESGLIERLTHWSIEVACQTAFELRRLGSTHPLSVNISPKLLTNHRLIDFVRETLARTEVPGSSLMFEVTEGILIDDVELVEHHMQELQKMGIRFSVDDFGTGYSNLVLLKRLPLSELKIDQSLVRDIPADLDDIAIARMILGMARQLNLNVVAEGVETLEQAKFLWENACGSLQGYLMARPLPIAHWLEAVRTGRTAPGQANEKPGKDQKLIPSC
ncbi:putative bifunctional diguanylate cyclase/phosphodiesterase [Castellaniella caeni]|uniref:putative bifunctional diguanylate cyclase/phosphodiesterase n=1 Tax=Castellaniella caeni TaxID=266123 RepID=UPI0018DB634C|nr:bifunctional diguanylate cyclase/phosphodiesterase [Castellaniella caeni]